MAENKKKKKLSRQEKDLTRQRIKFLLQEKLKALQQKEVHQRDNLLEYFWSDYPLVGTNLSYVKEGDKLRPNPHQKRLLLAYKDPQHKVFTITGSNRIGKTFLGAIIALSTVFGEWLWSGEKLHFSHKLPRKVRYIGQDWEKHISQVIVPELWKWWPKNRPLKGGRPKKNNVGVEYLWVDEKTGSSLEIMSNNQDSDLHEGWNGDLIVYDEPPRREIRVANARGLIDREGRELFCMTLLKEAWVHREIIKATLPDGSPDPTVFNVNATIEDNIGFGITREGVDQFAKTLTEEEKDARLRGIPSYMSGLVYPMFKREIHLKPRSKIPLDWMVDIAVDTHPRKPHSVLFMATSPRGFKYCIHEIREHGDGKSIAESIIRMINYGHYRVNRVIVDPLSKGDANSDPEGTTFQKMADVFHRYDILLETASKNKDTGVLMVKEYLMTANGESSLFVFNDLIYTIRELEGLMWEKENEKEKIQKVEDDMCENLYRLILLETEYIPPAMFDESPQTKDIVNETTGY